MCEKHPTVALQVICGSEVCGACYGEALERERYVPGKPKPPIDMSMGLFGHNVHYRPWAGG